MPGTEYAPLCIKVAVTFFYFDQPSPSLGPVDGGCLSSYVPSLRERFPPLVLGAPLPFRFNGTR